VWSNVVVGKISPWIDLDSPDPDIRFNSRKVLSLPPSYLATLHSSRSRSPPPSSLLPPAFSHINIYKKAFKQEIAWATHLSLPAVLLPAPAMHSINYAQCVNQSLLGLARMGVWLRVPLVSPEISLSEEKEVQGEKRRGE
jgi:hypothetical protein